MIKIQMVHDDRPKMANKKRIGQVRVVVTATDRLCISKAKLVVSTDRSLGSEGSSGDDVGGRWLINVRSRMLSSCETASVRGCESVRSMGADSTIGLGSGIQYPSVKSMFNAKAS